MEEKSEYENEVKRENAIVLVLFLLSLFAVAALLGMLGAEVDASKFVR